MDFKELFSHLREFDTPTICNALEIASGSRELTMRTAVETNLSRVRGAGRQVQPDSAAIGITQTGAQFAQQSGIGGNLDVKA